MNLCLHTWNQDIQHIVLDGLQHRFISGKLIMLRGDDDGINTLRNTIVTILYCYLTLGIRAQIGHLLSFLANLSKSTHNKMGKIQGYRHQVLCFICSVTKHHSLIASSLILVILTIHTTIDVIALLVNGCQDTAGVPIKLILCLRIADLLDGVTSYCLQVDIHFTMYLTHDDHLSSSHKRLTSHSRMLVKGKELV